jgi:outer membrane protein
MRHPFRIFLTLFLSFLPGEPFSQTSFLDDYISEGLENNLTLKEHRLSYEQSLQALREAKGMFYPSLSFEASYTRAGGGRALEFPVGDLLNPINSTLNELTQQQAFPTDIQNVNETFLPNDFHETKFRLVQPLFQPGVYYNHKIKQSLVQLEEVDKKTYERELIREIKTTYFQYIQSETALTIYQEARSLLLELYTVNEKLVKYDKALQDVLYSTRYELSEIDKQLQFAQRDKQTVRSYFNFLLNRPLDTAIKIDTLLQAETTDYSLDKLSGMAVSARPELEQLRTAMQINQYQTDMNRMEQLPTLNLVADAGFQGFGYSFDDNQDFWLVNLSMSWNLFQGNQRKARVQQSKIQNEILRNQSNRLEQQIQLQITQALYELYAARSAIEASEANVANARENYRIAEKRYRESKAIFIEVLDAHTKLTQAQLALNVARSDFLTKKAELEWAAGTVSD